MLKQIISVLAFGVQRPSEMCLNNLLEMTSFCFKYLVHTHTHTHLEGPEAAGGAGVLWEAVRAADLVEVQEGVRAGVPAGVPEAACAVWDP